MKNKKTTILVCLVASVFLFANYTVKYKTSGAHPGSTGAPGELTCAQTGCHTDAQIVPNAVSNNTLVFSGVDSTYIPGATYIVTVQAKGTGTTSKFGFEIVALKNADSTNIGQFAITDIGTIRTQILNHTIGSDIRFSVTHKTAGTPALSANFTKWTFEWTAPATNVGNITFWYAVNCTNNNGQNTGDQINLHKFEIKPNASVSILEKTNEAHFKAFYNNERKEIAFSYKLNAEKTIRVVLTDQQGKEIISTEAKVKSEGRHKDKLIIGSEIKGGVYFVQFQADNSSFAEKIIVH